MVPIMVSRVSSPSTNELRERIQKIEASHRVARRLISTGFAAFDRLLPDGGLAGGSLIEWASPDEGSGAATLALTVASHLLRNVRRKFVVIDRTGEFYPPAAARLGIPLERTIVVRPGGEGDACWAWEQSLRCPGVAVTFGWLPSITDRWCRRLQAGVEVCGGLGFLMGSPGCSSSAGWGVTRIGVNALPREGTHLGRCVQIELARGHRATSIDLEWDHETSDVPLVPRMGAPEAEYLSAG